MKEKNMICSASKVGWSNFFHEEKNMICSALKVGIKFLSRLNHCLKIMNFLFEAFVWNLHCSKNVDRRFKWRRIFRLGKLSSVDDEKMAVSSENKASSVLFHTGVSSMKMLNRIEEKNLFGKPPMEF